MLLYTYQLTSKLLIKYLIHARIKLMQMQQLKITRGRTKTNFFRNNDTNIFNVYYDKQIFESTLRKSRLIRWDEERYSLQH